MKVLIIGSGGMAGHMIKQYVSFQTDWDVWAIERGHSLGASNVVNLDVRDTIRVEQFLDKLRPDIVINAIGILNEHSDKNKTEAIYVNSLFPHLLVQYAERYQYRLIQISTDCVFSGNRGDYIEADPTDGITMYAKSKSLGEVVELNHLTIRTSIIGPELKRSGIGLFHWFMQQKGHIQGYQHVLWNGVTTLELTKAIVWCIQHPIDGLVHLSAPEKVSKYQLLLLLQERFAPESCYIEKFDGIKSDKSLINTRADFTYIVPPYAQMLNELEAWMTVNGDHLYDY